MDEKEFATINFKKVYIGDEFKIRDADQNEVSYTNIHVPGAGNIIRMTDQIKQSEYDESEKYFSVPKDYKFTAKRSIKDENGEWTSRETKLSVDELKEHFKNAAEYEKSEDFQTIVFSKNRLHDVFMGKDGVEYISIVADKNIEFIRKFEQIREVEGDPDKLAFSLPKDFVLKAREHYKTESGNWEDRDKDITIPELKDMLLNEDVKSFITFIVDKENVGEPKTAENGSEYLFVKIPGVGSIVRSPEVLQPVTSDPDKFKFFLASDQKLKLTSSRHVKGAPDDAPADKKYKTVEREVSAFDLNYLIYRQKEKEAMHYNNPFRSKSR